MTDLPPSSSAPEPPSVPAPAPAAPGPDPASTRDDDYDGYDDYEVVFEGRGDVVTALTFGWDRFRENVAPLVIAAAIMLILQEVLFVIGQLAVDRVALTFLIDLVGTVATTVLGLGLFRMALAISAGERMSVATAFRYPRLGAWIAFAVVFGLMVGVGIELFVVPGLLVLAFFGLAPYYFLDQELTVGEALAASRRAVVDNGLAFQVLLSIVVGVLGFVACFIGAFVTAPIAYLSVAYLYRYASAQPSAL